MKVSWPTNGSVMILKPSAENGALSAAGGTVEIAPLGGATMSLGKAAAAELTVTGTDLGKISSATLRLGGSAATAAIADSLVVRDAFDASTAATCSAVPTEAACAATRRDQHNC